MLATGWRPSLLLRWGKRQSAQGTAPRTGPLVFERRLEPGDYTVVVDGENRYEAGSYRLRVDSVDQEVPAPPPLPSPPP